MIKQRIAAYRALLREKNLDAMLVSNESNVRYLSGYSNHEAVLLIGAEYIALLITDFRYEEQARHDCPDYECCIYSKADGGMSGYVGKKCLQLGIGKLGFEPDAVSYAQYQAYAQALNDIDFVAVAGMAESLRCCKDEKEIAAMRHACRCTDRVFEKMCAYLRAGISEKQAEFQLLSFINDEGCESSFDPIVVSGVRCSLPHGVAGNKLIEQGDFVTMDFGCMYQGYHADMTRTVVIGDADTEQIRIYDIVLQSHLRGLAAVRPGALCADVDKVARDYIAACGYGREFGHSLGHGVGLDIHEAPTLGASSNELLCPGQLVTVEPGIYIPNWGGVRVEDTVLVTADGAESLFTSPKELLCL